LPPKKINTTTAIRMISWSPNPKNASGIVISPQR
jgi:hypothetical protein